MNKFKIGDKVTINFPKQKDQNGEIVDIPSDELIQRALNGWTKKKAGEIYLVSVKNALLDLPISVEWFTEEYLAERK